MIGFRLIAQWFSIIPLILSYDAFDEGQPVLVTFTFMLASGILWIFSGAPLDGRGK